MCNRPGAPEVWEEKNASASCFPSISPSASLSIIMNYGAFSRKSCRVQRVNKRSLCFICILAWLCVYICLTLCVVYAFHTVWVSSVRVCVWLRVCVRACVCVWVGGYALCVAVWMFLCRVSFPLPQFNKPHQSLIPSHHLSVNLNLISGTTFLHQPCNYQSFRDVTSVIATR